MPYAQAVEVAEYLKEKNMTFCYLMNGEFITRDYLTEAYGISFNA